ncbi:glycosyltransferase, family 2 [Thermococcus kodakarensis KOD1]|uniref:Glycosyltransferase, family 2 n=1 Tax=Thermococcus kodakarensis (strain ATCC BAA-918 / JCM 12380 / KOD1) TaxID=69014 RepID=Q5JJ27_THEKO|nr:glycosyltransferase [Thermococcus kodakarensis]WCN27635.1 glycosyltransferase [Thermococcus kodakarensis]WCN29926.1 glycosyltransferase [Thermococcus kodakarensis]BAD85906.1 glycosyltransferase, family 2 [Thermococcus kodakarensis KOD1]
MRPRVSVVIPTYGRDRLLRRAIESVLNQTFDDFEILIIDGARSESTKELVRSYGDGRLRYIPQRGKGIANARNIGVLKARGDFIAFLDDDDRWRKDKLELQLEAFGELPSNYGLVYTAFTYYYLERDKVLGIKHPKASGDVYGHLLKDNITGTSTIMVKRECFKKAGLFREDFVTCEDWDMWLRMAKVCRFGAIDEPLVDYSIHSGQFSFSKYLSGRYRMIDAHGDIRHDPRILSYHLLQIGVLKLFSGDRSGAREVLEAFRLNPVMRGNIRDILSSFLDVRTRIYILKFLGRL